MIRSLLLSAVAVGSLSLGQIAYAQTTVSTDPVGFITLEVAGTNNAAPNALSFLGLGMTQPVALQATLESASGTTVVDDQASWTDDQFNGANGSHYIELISGSGAGKIAYIVDTLDASNSLVLDEDISASITPGTSFRIRKNWTLASIFGATNSAGLGSGTASTADEVLIYDPVSAQYKTYYYKTAGITGGTGWRSTASLSADESNTPIEPTAGILVRRKQASNITFPLTGAVKLGPTKYSVFGGNNFAGNIYPTNTLTLGNSMLLESGFAGGSASTADLVLIYDQSTNPPTYKTYYYKTVGITGGTGWRSTASLSEDASGVVLPSGKAVIIQRKGGRPAFEWTAPQTFATN
jgi:uncharacterized protein (TIGR02597 family)